MAAASSHHRICHPVHITKRTGRAPLSLRLPVFPQTLAPSLLATSGIAASTPSHHRHATERKREEVSVIDGKALASILHGVKTADDVESSLDGFDPLPLPLFCSTIRGLGAENRLDAAFAIVEWMKRRAGSAAPNMYIYNSLLSAVKQARRFDLAGDVVTDMRSQGIAPNIVTYNTLMAVHLEQGNHDEALDVLGEIESAGLRPSPVTYSTALLVYKKTNDADGALRFYADAKRRYERGEIGGDECGMEWVDELAKLEKFVIRLCWAAMRRLLLDEEDMSVPALRLLARMNDAGLLPERRDYERLAWSCTREDHYPVAKELYGRIRESAVNGGGDGVSLSVCNHVIWLMGKARKWWAALEVYEDLLEKGPKPNNLSHELIISHFNVLLVAARKKGIWKWGVRLLNKMQDRGLKPGSREWNAVLVACSKASETTAAVQIFRRMIEQGEKPTVISYGALLSALEKGKLYDEALRVWNHMRKVNVMPNLHAYTILASIYAGKGSPEMIDSVVSEMILSKIEPTVVTFNAIITGCAKNGMAETALQWFHRMKSRNIQPNKITYEMLIEALARDGKPRLAYETYLRAYNEGLELSSQAYDAVVESCTIHDASVDLSSIGPRPAKKKASSIKIRKNASEFCRFAGVPRRGNPFDRTELYA